MHVSKRELHHAGSSFGGEGVALLFVRDSVPEDTQPLIVGSTDPRRMEAAAG
jgi:hypothetical protein